MLIHSACLPQQPAVAYLSFVRPQFEYAGTGSMSWNTTGGRAMRIASLGHAVFAATMIALGILGLIKGDFTPIWSRVPKGVPAREVLAYLCAFISLASGIGLLWQRTAAVAARVLLAYLLLWLLLFRVPDIFLAPTATVTWRACGETAVMVAAAWVLYAWFATDWDREHLGFATGDNGLRIARVLLRPGLDPLRRSPFHLCQRDRRGGAWLAAMARGLGVFHRLYLHRGGRGGAHRCRMHGWQPRSRRCRSGLFTLLVWVPSWRQAPSAFQWSEFVDSWALTAGAWVVADSYCGMPWLAVSKRCRQR